MAVGPDTDRGICEEGGLPGGGADEQVFSLQLAGGNRAIFLGWAHKVAARNELSVTLRPLFFPHGRPSCTHRTLLGAKKNPHLSFSFALLIIIRVSLYLRLFCHLIGPVKEVVQRLGVTAKTKRSHNSNRLNPFGIVKTEQEDHIKSKTPAQFI